MSDAMEYKELVALRPIAESIDVDRQFDFYWLIEMNLANEYGNYYSSLEEYGDKEQRRCKLCGEISETGEFGRPERCINERCNNIREFFQIIHFPECVRYNHSITRGSYLKKRITKLGYVKLSDIPDEIKFIFLFNVMMERIAHEKDNRGTEGNSV